MLFESTVFILQSVHKLHTHITRGDFLYIYRIKKETNQNSEIGNYTSYGIEAYQEHSLTPVSYIPDVFADYENAQKFIDLLNEYQAQPVHLEELCIDFIQ